MKKTIVISALTMGVAFAVASGAQAGIVTVNSWDAYKTYSALYNPYTDPSYLFENLENPELVPGLSITEINGAGEWDGLTYKNIVDNGSAATAADDRYQVFNFDSMAGFGGWFDLNNPGGPGSQIDLYIGSIDPANKVLTIPNTAAGQFYGFFSDTPFTQVYLVENLANEGWIETYYAVDVALTPTPEPATMLLFGTGLAGLAGAARRRKK